MDSKSNVLIKAVGGDGVNGTVRNIKFGKKIHRKCKIHKNCILKINFIIFNLGYYRVWCFGE